MCQNICVIIKIIVIVGYCTDFVPISPLNKITQGSVVLER